MNSKVMHFGSKIFEVNLKRLNTYLIGLQGSIFKCLKKKNVFRKKFRCLNFFNFNFYFEHNEVGISLKREDL